MANPGYPNPMNPMMGGPAPMRPPMPMPMPARHGTSKVVPVVVSAGLAVGVFCGLLFGLGTGKAKASTPSSGSNIKKDDDGTSPGAAPAGVGATDSKPAAVAKVAPTVPTVPAGSATTVPTIKTVKLVFAVKPEAAAAKIGRAHV